MARATISAVKAATQLLVRYLFWFTVLLLAAGVLIVAYAHVTGYDPDRASWSAVLVPRILSALRLAALPAIFGAAVATQFRLLRSVRPAPMVSLLVLVWSATLVGYGVANAALLPRPEAGAIVPAERIVRAGDVRLYARSRDGGSLTGLVVHDASRRLGFGLYPSATVGPDSARLLIPGFERSPVDLSLMENSYSAMVAPPAGLAALLADLSALPRFLTLGSDRPLEGLLLLGGLSIYLLGVWTLVRLTRWPLFNAVLAALSLRFAVWLVPAFHEGFLSDLVITVFDSRMTSFVCAAVLACVGIGTFAVSAFLQPLDEWRREVGRG